MLTGGVFPVDLGLRFNPNVPPGITVPEWYLTGLYAFLRSAYDKFTTGVAWPGLFIFSLLIIPFIESIQKVFLERSPHYNSNRYNRFGTDHSHYLLGILYRPG